MRNRLDRTELTVWSWLDSFWPLVLALETWLLVWVWRHPDPRLPFGRGKPAFRVGPAGAPSEIQYYALKHQPKRARVRVRLHDTAANVKLMDARNFRRYEKGEKHRYLGGYCRKSPVYLDIPHDDRWYVALHRQADGRIPSSVKVYGPDLPPMPVLPAMTPESSLVRIKENFDLLTAELEKEAEQKDVFVSYASEDGPAVAHPLARLLVKAGLSVWIDRYELRMGDPLRRKIDSGIASSRFGVVVLSPDFFRKGWPQAELDALLTREIDDDRQWVLPIWHRTTKEEVRKHSPLLLGRIARSTSDYLIEDIAEEIAGIVLGAGTSEDELPVAGSSG
ncbi:DUF1883 domain-containing protein [Lentzea rhizosphaerae]|uniref:DUF1883 domain-containing protein n=1 Tax=Lentzea rhizosphaerae TaxID=2041025 RepID=A0ABV8BK50_9PSEU